MAAIVSSRLSAATSVATTEAPAPASARAAARPIPEPPPVTSATLPSRTPIARDSTTRSSHLTARLTLPDDPRARQPRRPLVACRAQPDQPRCDLALPSSFPGD